MSTDTDAPVASAAAPSTVPTPRSSRRPGAWAALAPLLAYCAIFLGLPIYALVYKSLQQTNPATGKTSFTTANITTSWQGIYLTSMTTSLRLSLVTAALSAVVGLFAALAISQSKGRLLRQAVTAASGVLANFGGIPLAFCFIATAGTAGEATNLIDKVYPSFQLDSFAGLVLVYPYFLIPLMVLTTLPALEGLKPQWREAAAGLGGNGWQYWRLIGAPILLPALLGGFVLCFGSAFAAYATAKALVGDGVPLVTLRIADVLSGNVIAGQENLGMAMSINTILVCGVVMAVYLPLRKRSSRWLES
jgi:putative spermidine/putrescine transport system permease protein